MDGKNPNTGLNIEKPDGLYKTVIQAYRGLADEHFRQVNARLVLLLASHVCGTRSGGKRWMAATKDGWQVNFRLNFYRLRVLLRGNRRLNYIAEILVPSERLCNAAGQL